MRGSSSKPDTQIIKQSLCYRAKYRTGDNAPCIKCMTASLAVPHPRNRGGDPVVSMRTKELAEFIAKEGCDKEEASTGCLAVQDCPPESRGGGKGKVTFQEHFNDQVKHDPDMATNINGITAVVGTLSHSHFNCVSRNILAGMSGCRCGKTPCACRTSGFLNKGNYSIELLRSKDEQWAHLVDTGLPWEVLSWKMDVEEPEAALIISIACNKKNEAAMETAHTEIMKHLISLCKPNPGATVVEFEPIRMRMVEL